MKLRWPTLLFAIVALLGMIESGVAAPSVGGANQSSQPGMVFVCACLSNRSCPCITESRFNGPCACGTVGSPPMKAVKKDSDWAKFNRKMLGQ